MMKFLFKALGHTASKRAQRAGWIDVRLGYRLLRDRNVAPMIKCKALGFGFAITVLLQVAELPIESVVALLLPGFGLGFDAFFTGFEILVLPFLIAAALMPRLVRPDAIKVVAPPARYR